MKNNTIGGVRKLSGIQEKRMAAATLTFPTKMPKETKASLKMPQDIEEGEMEKSTENAHWTLENQ